MIIYQANCDGPGTIPIYDIYSLSFQVIGLRVLAYNFFLQIYDNGRKTTSVVDAPFNPNKQQNRDMIVTWIVSLSSSDQDADIDMHVDLWLPAGLNVTSPEVI